MSQRISRGLQRGPVHPRQDPKRQDRTDAPGGRRSSRFLQRPNTCSMEQPSLLCACAFDRDTTTNVYFFRRSEDLKHATLLPIITQAAPGSLPRQSMVVAD